VDPHQRPCDCCATTHIGTQGLTTNPGLNADMPVLDPITNPFFDPMAEGGLLRAPAAASSSPAMYATPPPQPPQPAK